MSRCDQGKVKKRGRRKNGWSRRWDQQKASMAVTGGDGGREGEGVKGGRRWRQGPVYSCGATKELKQRSGRVNVWILEEQDALWAFDLMRQDGSVGRLLKVLQEQDDGGLGWSHCIGTGEK